MSLKFKKSSKGQDQLLLKNYVFSKERVRSNKAYWRCIFYKSLRCPSRAVTNDNELISWTLHNHDLKEPDIHYDKKSMNDFEQNNQLHDLSEKNARTINNTLLYHKPVNDCKQYNGIQEAIKLKAKMIHRKTNQSRSEILKPYSTLEDSAPNQHISRIKSGFIESNKEREQSNESSDESSYVYSTPHEGLNVHVKEYREEVDEKNQFKELTGSRRKLLSKKRKVDIDLLSENKKMKVIDYTNWEDPNQLVYRLRLLVAEQSIGKLNNFLEVQIILEELRIAGYIE